ncbi:MAG TPA: PspC domain-containing protein [Candidatus Bathyarchaeia archaeon]|nr:PspC domain-containing protein [Candidatus Bathyarchaeia archaeon]
MKKLYRSRTDTKVAGVLGGVSDYLETDSTLVRVAFLLLTVFTGFVPGVVFYVIAAIIMPQEPYPDTRGGAGEV